MGISSTVSMARQFPEITDAILGRIVSGQNKAAERLLALASAEAPMDDDGTLVASGQVVPSTLAGEDAIVTFDTPYAARWHEDQALVDSLGRRYPGGSDFQNGRKSKYLEDPALKNKAELGKIIVNEAKNG